jgi:hypothetical protein
MLTSRTLGGDALLPHWSTCQRLVIATRQRLVSDQFAWHIAAREADNQAHFGPEADVGLLVENKTAQRGRILLWWQMPTELPPRRRPPTPRSLWPIFWDATIAIATATMVVEIIASLKWAFS